MTPAVEINELTKDYEVGFLRKRKVRALDRLTLEVGRGEIFGFLGANGAGKTTTLKLLMRLMYPTSSPLCARRARPSSSARTSSPTWKCSATARPSSARGGSRTSAGSKSC